MTPALGRRNSSPPSSKKNSFFSERRYKKKKLAVNTFDDRFFANGMYRYPRRFLVSKISQDQTLVYLSLVRPEERVPWPWTSVPVRYELYLNRERRTEETCMGRKELGKTTIQTSPVIILFVRPVFISETFRRPFGLATSVKTVLGRSLYNRIDLIDLNAEKQWPVKNVTVVFPIIAVARTTLQYTAYERRGFITSASKLSRFE